MYMSQSESKSLAQFIANETKDLRERVEKLEAIIRAKPEPNSPVGWGGHLPGKIKP